MKNKIIALGMLLLGMMAGASAQNTDLEARFAQELKEKCKEVKSIESRFIQTRSASVLARPVEKTGKYYFLQPYHVLLSFDDGDHIKITSTLFEIKQNGHIRSTQIASNPMLKNLNRMLVACLSGDVSQLTAGFETEITSAENEYTLRLLPVRGRSSRRTPETVLVFNRADMSLKMLRMGNFPDDCLEYKFYDVKYNTAPDPALFDIK